MDNAHKLAERLNDTIEKYFLRLLEADEDHMEFVPPDGSWSCKEIIGHLVDSAANNHQRLVRGPLKEDMIFESYDQDEWVKRQNYHDRTWNGVLNLWYQYNRHLIHVISNIPNEVLRHRYKEHNLDQIAFRPFPKKKYATLAWLIEDYIEHMEHHLLRMLEMDIQV
jgi:hypothetical protein